MQVLWSARSEDELPPSNGWLTGGEQRWVGAMRYTKRRSEFLVSRWTAKRAVAAAAGWEATDPATLRRIEITHRSTGAPIAVVDGVEWTRRISLTDRAGWAVCAIAAGGIEVGCDLEVVEPRSDTFVADYLTPAEQATVAAAGAQRDEVANLMWSAKESALKVLGVGLRRDTRSVEIVLGSGPAVGGWHRTGATVDGVVALPGWWRRFGSFVLTMAAEEVFDAPTAMVAEAGLAGAEPVHSWMAHPLVDPAG